MLCRTVLMRRSRPGCQTQHGPALSYRSVATSVKVRRTTLLRLRRHAGSRFAADTSMSVCASCKFIDTLAMHMGCFDVASSGAAHRELEGPQSYPLPRLPGRCGSRSHFIEHPHNEPSGTRAGPIGYRAWLRSPHPKRRTCPNPPCRRRIASRPSRAGHCRIPRSSHLIAASISPLGSLVTTGRSAPDAGFRSATPYDVKWNFLFAEKLMKRLSFINREADASIGGCNTRPVAVFDEA
jgi:hypothetical protein